MPVLELEISRLAHTGEGVAQLEGRSVFVAGALPGESVRAAVSQGKVLRGELLEVLRAHPQRRTPACPLAGRCGGCDWLHLGEEAQREAKQQAVVSALEHLGGVPAGAYRLLPLEAGAQPMGYRRRAVLHAAEGGLGFFGRHSHERVRVERCPALRPELEAMPGRLGALLAPVLKDLEEVRLLEAQDAVAVALVLKKPARPKVRQKAEELIAQRVVRGVVLVPPNGLVETFGQPELRDGEAWARPDVFAQANAEVNARLVKAAVAMLAPELHERVLELYCGNGNFTLELARAAKDVVAVESSRGAIGLAQKLGLSNVRWVEGDALKVAKGLSATEHFDALLLDPPRTGAPGIAGVARQLDLARLVYVACDAAALARDVKELGRGGYEPRTLQVFDLFPQTHHVEAVMLLAKA